MVLDNMIVKVWLHHMSKIKMNKENKEWKKIYKI